LPAPCTTYVCMFVCVCVCVYRCLQALSRADPQQWPAAQVLMGTPCTEKADIYSCAPRGPSALYPVRLPVCAWAAALCRSSLRQAPLAGPLVWPLVVAVVRSVVASSPVPGASSFCHTTEIQPPPTCFVTAPARALGRAGWASRCGRSAPATSPSAGSYARAGATLPYPS